MAPAFNRAAVYPGAPVKPVTGEHRAGVRRHGRPLAEGAGRPPTAARAARIASGGGFTGRDYAGAVTYSIVARGDDGRLGVGVQTCVMGVGAVCSWARAGVGAVATQAFSERGYGPRLLDRLGSGESPGQALAALRAEDDRREQRQVAVVGADGAVAAFTGADTISEQGDVQADGVSCQANMMARAGVPEAMLEAYLAAAGTLERRLLAALEAGERAGGDFRGRQSAALLVAGAERADEPWQGMDTDLRVDDDPAPLDALRRLVDVNEAYRLVNAGTEAAMRGDAEQAVDAAARARELAPHDQNVLIYAAVVRAHGGDVEPLRGLIAQRPGTIRLIESLQAHGETQLSEEAMALLRA
jgi:uncharacterized Ntn-hydrolase superfamily protein